ncbi:MAG TPA: transaldolase [Myxococcota bacterium]|nr:transaldolase [Myxococcota bacterium]
MKPTRRLHELGQSLWLDSISRELLDGGGLAGLIAQDSITGLTSNPTIFDHAIRNSRAYDASIRHHRRAGRTGEHLLFELIVEDLQRAADLFRPVHERTAGVDGWVSLEVSPLLAYDTEGTIAAAQSLWARAARPNLYIKIPGTRQGVPAIEAAIFAGVPINVTLLFSREQYLAAAQAVLRGIERRIEAGLPAQVASVGSLFVSRWDVAVAKQVPAKLRNRLGIAIAQDLYAAALRELQGPRWRRVLNFGARLQRPLWASTGTKDPAAPDLLYVEALAAPFTVNTLPEATLRALADHGKIGATMAEDGADSAALLAEFTAAGVDLDALAERLQEEGAAAFTKSWNELLASLESKAAALDAAH